MSKGGKVFTTVGLLLLAAALCLTGYNLWADAAAGSSALAGAGCTGAAGFSSGMIFTSAGAATSASSGP